MHNQGLQQVIHSVVAAFNVKQDYEEQFVQEPILEHTPKDLSDDK